MGTRDARIDAYITKSPDFAKPILKRLRETVHAACPDVEETMKWSHPHFMYKGMLCGMAAFKQHCAFNLWKGSLVLGGNDDGMGQFGRLTSVADLPAARTMTGYIRKAAALNEAGVAVRRAPRKAAAPARVPPDLAAALSKNAKARQAFDAFSPSHRREYIEWITGAKKDETRARRLQTAIAQIAEGKPQNWRYMKQGVGRKVEESQGPRVQSQGSRV